MLRGFSLNTYLVFGWKYGLKSWNVAVNITSKNSRIVDVVLGVKLTGLKEIACHEILRRNGRDV